MLHRSKPALPAAKCSGPSLTDVLGIVPGLLSDHVLTLWTTRGDGIKKLRLVNKDWSVIALSAVQTCVLDFTTPALPDFLIERICHARLKNLGVIVLTAQGPPSPHNLHQLAACTSQIKLVLSSLSSAISQVTRLDLNANCLESPEVVSAFHTLSSLTDGETSTGNDSDHISALPQETSTASVYGLLAAALPHLQHLSLWEQDIDIALSAFSPHCPKLRKLELHSAKVPTLALNNIHLAVPNLESLSLRMHDCETDAEMAELQTGVDIMCSLLHSCTNLTTLELLLGPEDGGEGHAKALIKCTPEVWDQLPSSLVKFRCDAELCSLLSVTSLMSRVQFLHLKEFPCYTLPQLLDYAPKLERFKIQSDEEVELMWGYETTPEGIDTYKAHLLRGLDLSCRSVHFSGETVEEIRDMMAWISPLHDTLRCGVTFYGQDHALSGLEQLKRVCPKLEQLSIADIYKFPADTDEAFLTPLHGCDCLKKLDVYVSVAYTYPGMLGLCTSLPRLESMLVVDRDDMFSAVESAMSLCAGRDICFKPIH